MAEYWDLYDASYHRTGELMKRGDPVPEGLRHLVVQIWIRDDAGRFLIAQRHPNKSYGLWWETTGGAVTAGEDSLTGAQRELAEELGIYLPKERFHFLGTLADGNSKAIDDVYEVRWNGGTDELKLQETEVVDAKWVDYDELCAIREKGNFVVCLDRHRKWIDPERAR